MPKRGRIGIVHLVLNANQAFTHAIGDAGGRVTGRSSVPAQFRGAVQEHRDRAEGVCIVKSGRVLTPGAG